MNDDLRASKTTKWNEMKLNRADRVSPFVWLWPCIRYWPHSNSRHTDHLLAHPQRDETASPQPAAPPLAPSNQLNGVHTFHWRHKKKDKLSQVSNLSFSWGLSLLSCYLSLSITMSVSPLPSHTALSVCYRWLWMNPAIYLTLTLTVRQSHSRSFMRASGPSNKSPVFSSQRERGKEEDYSVWFNFAQAGSVTMRFLHCFPPCNVGLCLFNNDFS